jgi:hypothetical protein
MSQQPSPRTPSRLPLGEAERREALIARVQREARHRRAPRILTRRAG